MAGKQKCGVKTNIWVIEQWMTCLTKGQSLCCTQTHHSSLFLPSPKGASRLCPWGGQDLWLCCVSLWLVSLAHPCPWDGRCAVASCEFSQDSHYFTVIWFKSWWVWMACWTLCWLPFQCWADMTNWASIASSKLLGTRPHAYCHLHVQHLLLPNSHSIIEAAHFLKA